MRNLHGIFGLVTLCLWAVVDTGQAQLVSLGTNVPPTLYPSIQAAVDAALPGNDVIRMTEGRFNETLFISNKILSISGGWESNLLVRGTGTSSTIDGLSVANTVWIMDSTCTLDGLNLVGGSASLASFLSGGGLLAQRSTVNLVDCTLQSNAAWYGGGGFVGQFATVNVDRVNCSDNAGLLIGGGLFVDGVLHMTNSTAARNNVTGEGGAGGGIFVRDGRLTAADSTIAHNTTTSTNFSDWGGGIGATNSYVDLWDGVQVASNAASLGAGIAMANCSTTLGRPGVVDDVMIRYNAASSKGGGIWAAQSVLNLRGATIEDNSVTGSIAWAVYGGGLYASNGIVSSELGTVQIRKNQSSSQGGGVYGEEANFLFSDLSCDQNEARNAGGGMVVLKSGLTMVNSLIQSNRSLSGPGGGLAAFLSQVTLVSNVTVEANEAPTSGGGGMIIQNCGLTMSNVTVRLNAAEEGGGLFIYPGTSVLAMANSSIIENSASLDGGGLWYGANSGTVWRSVFQGNAAGRDGGGIRMTNGILRVESSKILNNAALTNGGGVAISRGAIFEMKPVSGEPGYTPGQGWASVLQGNVSSNEGSAVFSLNTAHFLLDQTAVLENDARHNAVAILSTPNPVISRCIFAGNTSLIGYGLIEFYGGTNYVERCTLVDNAPYNSIFADSSALSVSNSIVWEPVNHVITAFSLSPPTIAYCQAPVPLPGIGNITGAPAFLMDYHLAAESAGINQGAVVVMPDIDGEPVAARIDIGADEFLDADHDNLPDLVESGSGIYVGDQDTGSSALLQDTDGDGIGDFDEWYATTDPSNSNDVLRMSRIWRENGTNYTQWVSGQGVDLVLEWNADPRTTNWAFAAGNIAPTLKTNEWPVNAFSSGVFRVRAARLFWSPY